MSNFRKLGNALVDFSRVRSVVPFANRKQIEVWYADQSCDTIGDDTPVETVAAAFEAALAQDKAQDESGVTLRYYLDYGNRDSTPLYVSPDLPPVPLAGFALCITINDAGCRVEDVLKGRTLLVQ